MSAPLNVTAITASAQLGGTERVLLDFAARAFEHDVALRVLVPRDGPLVAILNDGGVPCEVVQAPRSLLSASQQPGRMRSLIGAPVGLWQWASDLSDHPYFHDAAVYYTVGYKAHLATWIARRRPVVWHLHEFPPSTTAPLWRRLVRPVPDRVIANSLATALAWSTRADRRTGGRADGSATRPWVRQSVSPSITPVANGVDLDRFTPRDKTFWVHDELGIPHDHRLIGMPAVFARWKGQIEVLAAFRQVATEFPAVHLVFVGGSIYDTVAEREYGEDLMRAIAEARAVSGERSAVSGVERAAETADPAHRAPRTAHHVHRLPFQKKVERVYPEFDLALHYSTRPEPFGRVIVEAMACGVPVIAAGEGGPVEILGGGIGPRREAGWLAEPRDPAALARILRSALCLPHEVLRSVGRAARRRAEDHFSARRFAREVADVLKSVKQ